MPLEHDTDRQKVQDRLNAIVDAYQSPFWGSNDGKMILSDLFEFCCLLTQSEPQQTANGVTHTNEYDEGKRAVGMRILSFSGKLKEMREAMGVL